MNFGQLGYATQDTVGAAGVQTVDVDVLVMLVEVGTVDVASVASGVVAAKGSATQSRL